MSTWESEMTPEEWDSIKECFENGVCIHCGGDDVECLKDCTEHKCMDCEYVLEQDYSSLRNEREYHGGE